MQKLGEVSIYIPKDAIVQGLILVDGNQKPIGAVSMKPIRPAYGDVIQVEILHPPTP